MTYNPSFRFLALTTSALWLTACAVGPDFKEPTVPHVSTYTVGNMAEATEGAPALLGNKQFFDIQLDVPAAWWHLFRAPALNHLITKALIANPSLEGAKAALRAAQETAAAAYGDFLPALSGTTDGVRTKTSLSPKSSTLYSSSLNLTYAPDIFGATQRTTENLDALAEIKRFEMEATRLSLMGQITLAVFQEASLRTQIDATNGIIYADEKKLALIKQRFAAGAIARTAVLNQELAMATSKAALPALEQSLAQTRNMLATLMGGFPGQGIGTEFRLSSFTLPTELPLTLPSKMVQRRPDVRASLAALKAANAKIGIATAAMLPKITLSGSYGAGALKASDLFTPTTALWGLAAGLTQPLFEGGRLLHEKRASEANFDQAAATYRQTVLYAFKDVADSLKALETSARILRQEAATEQTAAHSYLIALQQFEAGAISRIDVLSTEKIAHQSRLGLAKAQAQRLTDTAALYQAFGGDWWHKNLDKTEKK